MLVFPISARKSAIFAEHLRVLKSRNSACFSAGTKLSGLVPWPGRIKTSTTETRSRTRHRNLTRLVSHVLLTSPLSFISFHLPKITCQDSLGLELGLAFQGVKIFTFDGLDDIQSWESDEKSVFGQSFKWPPKCGKVDFFSKVSFSKCENLRFS